MDEGRKRVIGIMAAILASLHMQTADDLFGTPQGSPRTDKLIAASIQWAEQIMRKIDNAFSGWGGRAALAGIQLPHFTPVFGWSSMESLDRKWLFQMDKLLEAKYREGFGLDPSAETVS
jgi:hypothetical protein